MKKVLASILALALMAMALTACGGGTSSVAPPAGGGEASTAGEGGGETPTAGGNLVIYSPNSEDMITEIIPLFEKETGIKVDLISMGTGEMFTRIESEQNSPNADVAWGGGRATYYNNLDLFESYTSANNGDVMDEFQNDTNIVTLYCLDGSCLLVNLDLVGDLEIKGYADLLDPSLQGRISMGDPAASSSAFAQLTNILLAMGGDYTSDDGWNYVEQLLMNTQGKVASGSQAVHKSVADGENIVALTYEDPSASYIKSGATNVQVVYPDEGAVYLPAGAAIIKGAENLENAQLFMDFIVSKTAQDAFGTQLTVRPVRADAELGDYMEPLENITLIYEDYDYVAENKDEIVAKYMDILTTVAD